MHLFEKLRQTVMPGSRRNKSLFVTNGLYPVNLSLANRSYIEREALSYDMQQNQPSVTLPQQSQQPSAQWQSERALNRVNPKKKRKKETIQLFEVGVVDYCLDDAAIQTFQVRNESLGNPMPVLPKQQLSDKLLPHSGIRFSFAEQLSKSNFVIHKISLPQQFQPVSKALALTKSYRPYSILSRLSLNYRFAKPNRYKTIHPITHLDYLSNRTEQSLEFDPNCAVHIELNALHLTEMESKLPTYSIKLPVYDNPIPLPLKDRLVLSFMAHSKRKQQQSASIRKNNTLNIKEPQPMALASHAESYLMQKNIIPLMHVYSTSGWHAFIGEHHNKCYLVMHNQQQVFLLQEFLKTNHWTVQASSSTTAATDKKILSVKINNWHGLIELGKEHVALRISHALAS